MGGWLWGGHKPVSKDWKQQRLMICWGATTALAPWGTSCRFIFSSFDEALTLAMILGWRFGVDWWDKQHAASANGSDGLNAGPHFAHAVRNSGHRCKLSVSGSTPRSKLPKSNPNKVHGVLSPCPPLMLSSNSGRGWAGDWETKAQCADKAVTIDIHVLEEFDLLQRGAKRDFDTCSLAFPDTL